MALLAAAQSSRPLSEPRRPIFDACRREFAHWSARRRCNGRNCSPRAASHSSILTVPLMAGPSSSPVMRKPIEPFFGAPCLSRSSEGGGGEGGDAALHVGGAAPDKLALDDLAGEGIDAPFRRNRPAAPRRYGRRTAGRARCRRSGRRDCRYPGVPGSEKGRRWVLKPAVSRRACRMSSAPASAGVTEGRRIRSRVRATPGLASPSIVEPRSIRAAGPVRKIVRRKAARATSRTSQGTKAGHQAEQIGLRPERRAGHEGGERPDAGPAGGVSPRARKRLAERLYWLIWVSRTKGDVNSSR